MTQTSTPTLTPDEQTLQNLLQAAIDVELYTIPLYMTAAYSLQFTDGSGKPVIPEPVAAPNGNQAALSVNQQAFNIVFSVFIQEMLHLMMACNISSALGFPPRLNPPDYTTGKLPHIKQPPAGITVALGPLDNDRLQLFKYIETPDFDAKNDPLQLTAPPEGFATIGALYRALRHWVNQLWAQRYSPNSIQAELFQYNNYPSEYTNKAISGDSATALAQANTLIDEIVAQGEGADAAGSVPPSFQPKLSEEEQSETPRESNDAQVRAYWDKYSHFVRFDADLAPLLLLKELTPWPARPADQQQVDSLKTLDKAWGQLLSQMTAFYDSPPSSFPFTAMRAFNSLTTNVWVAGGVPDFKPQ